MLALHTNEGVFLYCNDFKFDNNPIVGKEPNYEMLKEIAKEGVKAMVVDSLYSGDERKTASEKIARGLLEDTMLRRVVHRLFQYYNTAELPILQGLSETRRRT
jgi:ribonuclease J